MYYYDVILIKSNQNFMESCMTFLYTSQINDNEKINSNGGLQR